VPHGQQIKKQHGSSSNLAEVNVVNALVMALTKAGIPTKDICVVTGYTWQKKLLTRRAKANAVFLGDRSRANVATSRQEEALFFVGDLNYWSTASVRAPWMHKIIWYMTLQAERDNREFVVRSQRLVDKVPEQLAGDEDDNDDPVV
ncbi:MAG: hypothetical protein Q9174_001803, partial [Haloplaca sp. 1 TL-2023]